MKIFGCFITFFVLLTFLLPGIQSPDQFLGFKLGEDKNLAHYDQIKGYFVLIGQESVRVNTVLFGKTTQNNDMVMAVISAPENLKKLDYYKKVSQKLSLAEVESSEAKKLSQQGKVVVFITCNLHATEIGSSQMAMELIYKLATENGPVVNKILDNVIFVLIPSVNPDGQIMVVNWYNKNLGTRFEGGNLPYIYHWYAGHDNNRDWYKINLKETWNVTKQLYYNWFPQILVDEHQMGGSGDRFFIPPFQDPPTPGVHPLVWRTINVVGSGIALDLEMLNYKGVASRGYFTGWWIGALDDSAWFHNIAGILFEAASVRIATPIYIEPEEVRSGESRNNEERIFSPSPWSGGWWKLRDIINYELYATLSVLKTAAQNREEFLWNSFKMASDNIHKGKNETPFAYIIPASQWDPLTAEKLVKTLLKSNIKIFKLKNKTQIGALFFKAGSFVVPLAQPYRSFVKNIFERQHYPDLRKDPGESPVLPYDVAGWTLHLGMGVQVKQIEKSFHADMDPVGLEDVYTNSFPSNINDYILLNSRFNSSYMAASVLLKKGFRVWRNDHWAHYPKGSFLAKKSESLVILRKLNKIHPVFFESPPNIPLEQFVPLKHFKVALYQNWGHNMVEGWTRFVFDEFKIDYETVHNRDILKKNFVNKFDVLVFVGVSKRGIDEGLPPKKWERWFPPLPPAYSGGLGKKGIGILRQFVQTGKTLVFMGDSCDYAIEKFKMSVINIKEKNKKIVCPGSYVQAFVKESELTLGFPKKIAVFYEEDPVFNTYLPKTTDESRRTPVIFGQRDLLLSGWLEGESFLKRKSLVIDYKKGNGRIILIGPDVIHRAQAEGTYKIMFNALFTASR